MHQSFLVHAAGDVVGVAVQDLVPGSAVRGRVQNGGPLELDVLEAVPLGHKIALRDFANGDTVTKYGQDIGKVVAPIRKGEHVHVHNLKTKRW
jgi:(2R)-sulfolactate sulfo-lyase subunit alpha